MVFYDNVILDSALILYLIFEIKYLIDYFRNKDQQNNFNQAVGLELILFLIIIGIIAWALKERSKTKTLKKANYLLDVKANYNKALETFIGIKDWDKAAETVVKSPPGTQIVLLRQLQAFIPQSKIKSIFMKVGDYYTSQNQSNLAASAFQLADMPWRAAQSYIINKNVNAAIDVINTTPIFTQDKVKATRNLAKFAYDNNYPVESAQLLQSIGAEDEAVAVLIAAGQNSNIIKDNPAPRINTNPVSIPPVNNSLSSALSNPSVHSTAQTTVNTTTSASSIRNRSEVTGTSSFAVIKTELVRSQEKLKEGKIFEAEEILSRYTNLLSRLPDQNSEESISLKGDFTKTAESIKRLIEARAAFKARKIEQAQIIYSELLESAGDLFSAEIFAEAGLSYEYEPADKELASEFFVEASRKAKTPQAGQRYKERADLLIESIHEDLPKAPEGEKAVVGKKLSVDPNEKCCVCRRPVGTSGEVVQCNSCKSVAHYPHMAEWLKIKGVCPVCKQKLTMPETSKVALME